MSKPYVEQKFDNVESQLAQVANDINSLTFFPRIVPETNDYPRMIRAIDNTSTGGLLKIPNGTYDLNSNDVRLNKKVTIQGEGINNTIFINGGFSLETSDIQISNLFVNCPSLDNGFQINQAVASNILISNCKSTARDHSFLIESYNGIVQNVTIENCVSESSIHGFISKAINVRFINCKAINHTGFAFGFISDNIPSSAQIANCISSKILNCEVDSCGTGFFSYCRDKWSTTCAPRVNNNSIDGLVINNTGNPLAVGEEIIPTGYLSIYRIDFMTINNVRVINPSQNVWAISLRNCYRCIVDNCILPYKLEQKTTAQECLIGNIIVENSRPHTKPITLSSTGTSGVLDTSLNSVFEIMISGNPTDTVILTGLPKNGSTVTIIVRATSSTSFAGFNSSNIKLAGNTILTNFVFNHGQISQWMWVTGLNKFVCISTSTDIDLV